MIGLFKELDLDYFVALLCAPNGSVRNKVEISISALSLVLEHSSLSRKDIPDESEKASKNCSAMKSTRDARTDAEDKRAKALGVITCIDKKWKTFPFLILHFHWFEQVRIGSR